MSKEEALKVARILTQADDGCPVCVRSLFLEAMKVFPKHDWKELALKVGFDGGKWTETE